MSDNLVERLHDRRVCSPAQNSCRNDHVLNRAANRIEELERAVRYEADVAQQALDSRKELKAKLAKAMKALDEAVYLLAPDEKDMARQEGVYRIVTTLAELSRP